MRPGLKRGLFAQDVLAWLARENMSFTGAVLKHPALNKAMLSRAKCGAVLSVESFLALCRAAALDPMHYLDDEQNQGVTANAQRETPHVRAH